MALLVGELKSVLDLDTSKYDQGLDRSHDRFKKFVKGAAIASAAVAVAAGAGLLGLAKGAAEDEKAQAVLAKTLKNTAKATDAQVASIEAYITKTGAATGVTDDEMRPALANLVRATHDVGKAQSLMGLAMDVSAGTGKDLGAVTMALAKAQNGSVGGLAKLGIATKDASGKTKSFEQIQKDLAKTFTGQSAAAAETTAGKFDRLKLIVSEAGESIGAKVLPVLLTLGTFLLEKVVPAVVTFGTRVEIKLLPVLREVRDFFATQIIPKLKDFVGFVTGTLIPGVADIVSGFAGLGKKVVTAIGPIDLSGISTGIFQDTKAWAGAVIGGLKLGIETGDWKPLGKAVGDGVIRAIQTLGDKSGAILDAVGGLIDKVDWGALGTKISTGITGLFAGVDWKALGSSLGDAVVNLVDKASDLGVKLGTAFKTLINRIDWKKIGNDSTGAIISFIAGIDWAQVGKALSIAVFKSLKINKTVYDGVIKGATDLVTGMFWAIIHAMQTWRVQVTAYVKDVGGDLVAGLWSGIRSGMKGVGNFLKSVVVDPVVGWVKSLFGVHSPSTVFVSIGAMLIAGLRAGIASGMHGIGAWLSRTVVAPVVGAFSRAGSWLVQHGRNFVAGFKAGISQIASGIGRWIYGKVISPAVAPFARAGTWLYSKGRNVIAGFRDGMVSVWGDVAKWVGGIATWIKDHKGPVSLDGRLLIPAGRAIMSGFLSGLKTGAGPAWSFVKSVGGKTKEAVAEAYGWIKGFGWPMANLPADVAAGVLGGPNRRVFYQGEAFDLVTYQKLAKAMQIAGAINVTQGGYESASSYSGTTHTGGGVFDVVGGNLTRTLAALKASGLIGWIRNPSQGPWPWHIHALDPSDTGRMSASARAQVANYYRGGNGLGGFKNGGWLMPGQLAYNETRTPEPILNQAQWNILARQAGGGPVVLHDSTIGKLATAMIKAAREIPVVVDPRGLDEAMSSRALAGGY